MPLTAWHCHLDADLSFLLPGKYLLQIEQNLPTYPLPVPPPTMPAKVMTGAASAAEASAGNVMAGKQKLQVGLQWWRERWLAVLHPNAARFFALLHGQGDIISFGLTTLPEKITFPPEALQAVTGLLPAWQAAFPFLTLENYEQFCLGEVRVHGENYAVLDPSAFLRSWLGN